MLPQKPCFLCVGRLVDKKQRWYGGQKFESRRLKNKETKPGASEMETDAWLQGSIIFHACTEGGLSCKQQNFATEARLGRSCSKAEAGQEVTCSGLGEHAMQKTVLAPQLERRWADKSCCR